MRKYKYFVSFLSEKDLKRQYSSLITEINIKIKTKEDVLALKDYIDTTTEHIGDDIVLLGFTYLGRSKGN